MLPCRANSGQTADSWHKGNLGHVLLDLGVMEVDQVDRVDWVDQVDRVDEDLARELGKAQGNPVFQP